MSVIQEISQLCETEALRVPVLVRVPKVKYDLLVEEFKGMLRFPQMEMVPGETGWRLETAEEYRERVNKPPATITLNLTTGSLLVLPYKGTTIEVEFEKYN